jgi:hypothetical protein
MATTGDPKAQRVILVSPGTGVRIEGGPARPIKQLASNAPTNGAPIIRVALVNDGRARMGGPAMPVVVVTGSADATPILPVYAT